MPDRMERNTHSKYLYLLNSGISSTWNQERDRSDAGQLQTLQVVPMSALCCQAWVGHCTLRDPAGALNAFDN